MAQQSVPLSQRFPCPACKKDVTCDAAIQAGRGETQCGACTLSICIVCETAVSEGDHTVCATRLSDIVLYRQFMYVVKEQSKFHCVRCRAVLEDRKAVTGCNCGTYVCGCCGRPLMGVDDGDGGGTSYYEYKFPPNDIPAMLAEYNTLLRDHSRGTGLPVWVQPTQVRVSCPIDVEYLCLIDPDIATVVCAGVDAAVCVREHHVVRDFDDKDECLYPRRAAAYDKLDRIRVRYHLQRFMLTVGVQRVVDMLTKFGMRDEIDQKYYRGRFPWDTAAKELPSWENFEEPVTGVFYNRRVFWIENSSGPVEDLTTPK